MINTKKEALEFLAENPEGNIFRLEKIDKDLIKSLEDSKYVVIKKNNYQFHNIVVPSSKMPDYASKSFKRRIKKAKEYGEHIKKLSGVDCSKLNLHFEV